MSEKIKNPTIGMRVTRFFYGERFVFIYRGQGEWECDKNPYPPTIFDFT